MTRNNVPTRQRVFCASLADVFEDRPDVFFWRDDLFRLIEQTPNLDWLLLTKRPENIKRTLPDNVWIGVSVENQAMADKRIPVLLTVPAKIRFLSCEPLLGSLDLPVLMRDNLGTWNERINWVIAGGESGPEARPMDPRWMRSLRDQCQVAAVPFFFKQWGEYAPFDQLAWATDETMFKHRPVDINGSMMCRVGKGKAGHILDGCEWREIPH
jgi:protein gp37